jgi:hypothetical protein
MSRPRPVPSGCIDTTPADLWDVLWKADPEGRQPMPTEVRLPSGRLLRFWKGYYPGEEAQHEKPELPAEFWQAYWRKYPKGVPEDNTPRHYVSRDAWDDAKHGYFRCNGKLIYKHPNGTIYCNGVTGADRFD